LHALRWPPAATLYGRCASAVDRPVLPTLRSLPGHDRAAQGIRSSAALAREGWRQGAPPALTLGLAVHGCCQREEAERLAGPQCPGVALYRQR
jgi:hypothetical protein